MVSVVIHSGIRPICYRAILNFLKYNVKIVAYPFQRFARSHTL
uniref:Uncharacterized protein n=1 Tax=Heterorhabditis bacteriophora TaxID=37862 RepID=A0A1I7XPZ1_HETBA